MTATLITGDVFDCLAATPDESVDLVLTSPPFLALRSYLPADHPDKAKEIGQEPDPASFVDTLLRLSAEFRRVLAPHGSIAVELGDTYSGSGGAGGDYGEDGLRAGQGKFDGSNSRRGKVVDHDSGRRNPAPGWPEAKSACLIPELYRIGLAYGINPLTGNPSPAGRWRVRNTVRWCRPNPPVGALGDKFRPATSDMVIACLDTPAGQRRYFDLDAVRTPHKADPSTYTGNGYTKGNPSGEGEDNAMPGNPAGAPPLDWWEIPTQPYSGSHYAVWPPALLERPIKAMCPQRVCTVCGEPSRRIVEVERTIGDAKPGSGRPVTPTSGGPFSSDYTTTTTTLGWTDCGHNTWRNGLILDPFAGSGTTLAAATGHGRDALGYDLDPRNVDLATERVGGLFLTHLTLDEWREQAA